MPFDGLLKLAERLREIGARLPDGPDLSRRVKFAVGADMTGPHECDHYEQFLPSAFGPLPFAHGVSDWQACQQRQTEILLRVDENIRRLRELMEARTAVAAGMIADSL